MLISLDNGRIWINPDKIIRVLCDDNHASLILEGDTNFVVTQEEFKKLISYHNPYEYKYVYGEKTSVDVLKES